MAQRLKIASFGEGIPLVLLHGWGLNSGVFQPLTQALSTTFKVILVDLPGYGNNANCLPEPYDLPAIAAMVTDAIEEPAIYLGWSLGGLVASQIALSDNTAKVMGLITVASSPHFAEQEQWPGIKPALLTTFHQQIAGDIEKTLNGFLKIQAMGSAHIKEDIKQIQSLVMSAPLPNRHALDQGLNLLSEVDIRPQLHRIEVPFLRIYGKMDSLVPQKIIQQVNDLAPKSSAMIFDKASHAPFISNFHEFTHGLSAWLEQQNF